MHRSRKRPLMSELGHFRQIGTVPTLAACPLHLQERPNVGTAAKQRDVPLPDSCSAAKRPSFDDLVGAQQEPLRDVQPESLGGGQIDDEIELGRLLDGQISGLCPTQNLVHVFGGAP